jgi:hypothetical protein
LALSEGAWREVGDEVSERNGFNTRAGPRKKLHNGGWGPKKPCRWCGKLVHTTKNGSLRFSNCEVRPVHPEFGWMQACELAEADVGDKNEIRS